MLRGKKKQKKIFLIKYCGTQNFKYFIDSILLGNCTFLKTDIFINNQIKITLINVRKRQLQIST